MRRTSAFPDLVTAMSDPRLFGPMFAGASWDNWRTILRAALGLPMTEAEIAFFRTVANREPPGKRVKELDIIAGRRSGKDSVTSAVACYAAATFKADGKVRPGERPIVMLLGADRSQARSLLSYVKGYFAEIPPLAAMVGRETLDGLELTSGVDIVVSTADFKLVRGRTVLLAIFNETAFWPSENSASPDTEVHRAVQPAMATLADAMLIMISSAYKRDGLLYERWKRFYGTDDPNTLIIHAKTADLNPTISKATIEAALADDPEAAKAEWLSLWRDDLASYLTRQEIEACVDRGITVRARQAGVQYQSWIDASSGAGKDSMCCACGHRVDDNNFVVDCVVEIVPPFSPPDACSLIANTLKSYGITRTMGDRWGLNFVAAEFQRHGITLEYSDKHRSDIYREALPLLTSKRARLIDNERMIGQFSNLERRAMSGGREVIDRPQRGGHHDDVSLVVAGCLVSLAMPITGAEAFIEFYRRQVEEPWRFRHSTDYDDIRTAGPEFNWNMSDEPLVNLFVPPVLASGMTGVCYMEGKPYIQVTRAEAKDRLLHPAWRALNAALKELLGEDV
jgi:hypothetical protein